MEVTVRRVKSDLKQGSLIAAGHAEKPAAAEDHEVSAGSSRGPPPLRPLSPKDHRDLPYPYTRTWRKTAPALRKNELRFHETDVVHRDGHVYTRSVQLFWVTFLTRASALTERGSILHDQFSTYLHDCIDEVMYIQL